MGEESGSYLGSESKKESSAAKEEQLMVAIWLEDAEVLGLGDEVFHRGAIGVRKDLSSTIEACPPLLLAALVSSTGGSPSTSSPHLTIPNRRLQNQVAPELRMRHPPPVTTLHLYISRCSTSLIAHDALGDPRLVFADFQMASNMVKLSEDYVLEVKTVVDPAKLAVKETNKRLLERAGLRRR
ncbi:hypothetical protein NL676_000538 [Syzygium grande]|nr:hypothetical protein NL676_000538 [Syzygium grande]